MKLVWCPDTASKAYIDAVRSLSSRLDLEDSNVAELVAAMAGGWKAKMVVEACARGDSPATSLALAAALKHTHGRRVVVPADYSNNLDSEGTVGEADEMMGEAVEGVDFLVVDMRRRDAGRVMREAIAGPRGMVVVCKNVEKRKGGAGMMPAVGKGMRVVRSAYLPIGRGVEILHVGVGKGPRLGRRWFKHVDPVTGEEHLFRK